MPRLFILLISLFSFTYCDQSQNTTQVDPIKADTLPVLTKSLKLDTAYFWQIMDYAFAKAKFNNPLKEHEILEQLIKLTPEQIQEFEIIFQQMNLKANTWNNMAAQTIIEGGSSDDRFFYFRCWLISLGKYHFEETLKNPDHLSDLDIPINKEYGYPEILFEELIPLSDSAYEVVTKKDPSKDTTFPRDMALKKGLFYDSFGETKGVEWNDSDLPKIAPKLYKKYRVK